MHNHIPRTCMRRFAQHRVSEHCGLRIHICSCQNRGRGIRGPIAVDMALIMHLYVCMYGGMYVCVYVCVFVCMYVCVCVCVCCPSNRTTSIGWYGSHHAPVCMYMYVCMCVCLLVCMYVCMHKMYVCMHKRIHVRRNRSMMIPFIHAYIHKYMYAWHT